MTDDEDGFEEGLDAEFSDELESDLDDAPPIPWDRLSWPIPEGTSDFHWAIFQMELTDDVLNVHASFREFARQAELERFRVAPSDESTFAANLR